MPMKSHIMYFIAKHCYNLGTILMPEYIWAKQWLLLLLAHITLRMELGTLLVLAQVTVTQVTRLMAAAAAVNPRPMSHFIPMHLIVPTSPPLVVPHHLPIQPVLAALKQAVVQAVSQSELNRQYLLP